MKSRLPSTGDIEAFSRIAEGRSLVEAAEELNITASGVSRRILSLEAALGTQLVERRGTRLALTSAGTLYAEQLWPIVAALRQAADLLRQQHRTLRIASTPILYATCIAPRLGRFLQAWPDANIELLTHGMHDVTIPDISIRSGPTTDALPGENRLLDFAGTPFCRRELLEQYAIDLPMDLVRAPLIQNVRSRDAWPRWFMAAGVRCHSAARLITVDSAFITYQSVLNGVGVGFLPLILPHGHGDNEIISPFHDISIYIGSAFIAMTANQPRPIVRAFRDWMIAEVGTSR